ncbi:phage antirepressor N-terminal domain-containing protein [Undibacterium sp. KW1]|uniref:phage antirepressor N-terminal domain-containing protein n=1 Tax=Undibacterium sp. KW1 TaxID=2058624 RepID=UPI0018D6F1CD|nr:phage antirepressor N-terminal domain-containing protein [Undibacterium sp. KW1]
MQTQIIPVPFYEDTLTFVNDNNEPMVPMKPLVEGMGLAWESQRPKLNDRFQSTTMIIMAVGEDGKNREMVCLPLRKLAAWLTYHRGGDRPVEQRFSGIDEITFQNTNSTATAEQVVSVVQFLSKKLKAISLTIPSAGEVDLAMAESAAIHTATLTRLEQLNEELIKKGSEQNLEYRKKLDEEFDTRISKRLEELEEERKKFTSEILIQQAELTDKSIALDEKLKTIDDSNNTHARRQNRENILKDVQDQFAQFGVSEKTEKKREPVQRGMFALFIVFMGILALSISQLTAIDITREKTSASIAAVDKSSKQAVDKEQPASIPAANISPDRSTSPEIYALWIRITLLSFGLVGTTLYYIKWTNKWAEHHANLEFQLQQFKMDINRANWAIESSLEWQKNTATSMPTELLTSITRGLFITEKSEPERVIHPADELASALLGSASKLTLKSGENQLEFNNPGKIPNKT